jgi:hypothetical protein
MVLTTMLQNPRLQFASTAQILGMTLHTTMAEGFDWTSISTGHPSQPDGHLNRMRVNEQFIRLPLVSLRTLDLPCPWIWLVSFSRALVLSPILICLRLVLAYVGSCNISSTSRVDYGKTFIWCCCVSPPTIKPEGVMSH